MINIIYMFLPLFMVLNGDEGPKQYVFYLHGMIVEEMGLDAHNEQFGKYEYLKILDALKANNREVLSEIRPSQTDVTAYAKKIVIQINELINKGIHPDQITVIGASKGALIAMQASTLLKNQDVNFILIAGYINNIDDYYNFDLYGNVLGFYESSDQVAGRSYQPLFNRSKGINRCKEIQLNTGLGHGIVFKPLDEWVLPSLEWINGR
jgi:hypothetical protein